MRAIARSFAFCIETNDSNWTSLYGTNEFLFELRWVAGVAAVMMCTPCGCVQHRAEHLICTHFSSNINSRYSISKLSNCNQFVFCLMWKEWTQRRQRHELKRMYEWVRLCAGNESFIWSKWIMIRTQTVSFSCFCWCSCCFSAAVAKTHQSVNKNLLPFSCVRHLYS